jgi:hypothetical protein
MKSTRHCERRSHYSWAASKAGATDARWLQMLYGTAIRSVGPEVHFSFRDTKPWSIPLRSSSVEVALHAPPHSGLSAPRSLNITFNAFRQSAASPTRSTSIPGAK